MMKNELPNEYFEWLYQLVCNEKYYRRLSHRKLLVHLHYTPFEYTIGMDGNRAEDGTDLRYRFGYERQYEDARIASYLDFRPCSVLEMLVALAIRCEEHIMDDPDIGNRTGQWFWNMITNLGLGFMSDELYDNHQVDVALFRFLNREYKRNGEGGLFAVKDCKFDLRTAEIWYQMCWYLDSIIV